MRIVYYSVTGQTRRFISKLNTKYDPIEITSDFPDIEMIDDFIIITPTYAEEYPTGILSQEIMDPVFEFMDYQNNKNLCKGVIGCGNKNFGPLYAITGKEISKKYDVPFLFDFEFQGLPSDVEFVQNIIDGNVS